VTIIAAVTFTLWFSGALWNAVIPGGWSIQAEVGHYLFFPLVRNRSVNIVFLILTFINIATFCINYLEMKNIVTSHIIHLVTDAWLRLGIYSTFGYFLLGIFSYQLSQNYTKTKSAIQAYKSLDLNILNLIAYVFTWLILPVTFSHHGQIQTLAFVLLYIWLSRLFLKIRPVRVFFQILGRFSYFLYFSHFIFLEIFSIMFRNLTGSLNFSGSFGIAFIAHLFPVLIFSCLLAILSERFIERPFIELARRR